MIRMLWEAFVGWSPLMSCFLGAYLLDEGYTKTGYSFIALSLILVAGIYIILSKQRSEDD